MNTYLPTILIPFLLLAGCSLLGSDEGESGIDVEPIDLTRYSQAPPLLVGRWEWIHSTYYGPGEPSVERPGAAGRTETLVFPSTDSLVVYRDGTIEQRTSREMFLGGTTWGVRNDTLVITTTFLDGPESVYLRVGGSSSSSGREKKEDMASNISFDVHRPQ